MRVMYVRQRVGPVGRLDDTERHRKPRRVGGAVGGDVVVDAPGVGEAVGPVVAVPWHDGSAVDATGVHDFDAHLHLVGGGIGGRRRARVDRRHGGAEHGRGVTDVMVHVEHGEPAKHARNRFGRSLRHALVSAAARPRPKPP
jgi:hypothetical protein